MQLVNYGYRNDCIRCKKDKGSIHGGNVPPASPSVSVRHPPPSAPGAKADERYKSLERKHKGILKRLSVTEEAV